VHVVLLIYYPYGSASGPV